MAARSQASKRAEVPLNDEAADGLLDHDPAPDAEFERMQEHEFFESLVEQFACGLPERERSIVVMHWVEGRTFSEIAGALGMPKSSAAWVVRRVKPGLLDHLRQSGLATA